MSYRPRVAIIDDHDIVVRGLTRVLDLDGSVEVVGAASSLAEGIALCQIVMPDAVLLDLKMQDSYGVATVETFRAACPDVKIVVISALGNGVREASIRAGASLFLSKELVAEKLVSSICGLFPTRIAAPRAEQMLSEREMKVAQLVSTGMSNREVADTLFISSNTVKTHLRRVLSKLGLRDRVQLARTFGLEESRTSG